jgi:hypothetical protein
MQRLRDIVIVCVATALTACVEISDGLAPEDSERDDAALESEADAAAACPTFDGTWLTDEAAFKAAIAPATTVDFSKRANGATPTAGVMVPADEYLACCGIRLEYVGDPRSRGVIWVGNSSSGFSIQGRCRAPDECFEPTGIRITFVPATTAAGVRRGSIQTGVMFDAQNTPISTPVPSAQFVGYKSAVPIDHAEFKRIFAGASLAKLVYRRCS